MKKSFMSRVLAVTLSAAMAFSLSSANLVTTEAASKPKLTVSPTTATKSSGNRLVILKGAKQKFTVKSVKGWKLTAKSTAAATVSVSKPTTAKPVVTVKGKTASKNATITLTATKGKSKVTKKLYVYVGAKTTTAVLKATSIEAGKTTTLTLKDAKAWKITKATSSKKTVATVKVNSANKVTITGVAAGTSSIKATYAQRYFAGKTNKKDATATKTTKAVKVTVTEKDEPAPTTPSAVAVTGVTLGSTTPKVGDTITANVEPSNATNVASYQWYTGATASLTDAISGATNASFAVTKDQLGKFIGVVVTDTEGKSFTAVSSVAVQEAVVEELSFTAKQTGAKLVELEFNKEPGTQTYVVKKGTSTVEQKVLVSDGTKVTLEFASNLTAGDYEITATDSEKKAVKATFTAEAAKLDKVEFKNDSLVVSSNTTEGMKTAYAAIDSFDQWGKHINLTNPTFTISKGTGSFAAETGILTIKAPTNAATAQQETFTLGEQVVVTLMYDNNTKVVNQILKVTMAATAAELEFGDVTTDVAAYKDKRVVQSNVNKGVYFAPVKKAVDSYGVTLTTDRLNEMLESTLFISPNTDGSIIYAKRFVEKTIAGEKTPCLEILGGTQLLNLSTDITGTINVLSQSGMSKQVTLDIQRDPVISDLSITVPELYNGKPAALTITAKDQYGDDYNLYEHANNTLVKAYTPGTSIAVNFGDRPSGSTSGTTTNMTLGFPATSSLTVVKNTKTKTVDFTITPNLGTQTTGYVTISGSTANYKAVAPINASINATRTATGIKEITGLSENVAATFAGTVDASAKTVFTFNDGEAIPSAATAYTVRPVYNNTPIVVGSYASGATTYIDKQYPESTDTSTGNLASNANGISTTQPIWYYTVSLDQNKTTGNAVYEGDALTIDADGKISVSGGATTGKKNTVTVKLYKVSQASSGATPVTVEEVAKKEWTVTIIEESDIKYALALDSTTDTVLYTGKKESDYLPIKLTTTNGASVNQSLLTVDNVTVVNNTPDNGAEFGFTPGKGVYTKTVGGAAEGKGTITATIDNGANGNQTIELPFNYSNKKPYATGITLYTDAAMTKASTTNETAITSAKKFGYVKINDQYGTDLIADGGEVKVAIQNHSTLSAGTGKITSGVYKANEVTLLGTASGATGTCDVVLSANGEAGKTETLTVNLAFTTITLDADTEETLSYIKTNTSAKGAVEEVVYGDHAGITLKVIGSKGTETAGADLTLISVKKDGAGTNLATTKAVITGGKFYINKDNATGSDAAADQLDAGTYVVTAMSAKYGETATFSVKVTPQQVTAITNGIYKISSSKAIANGVIDSSSVITVADGGNSAKDGAIQAADVASITVTENGTALTDADTVTNTFTTPATATSSFPVIITVTFTGNYKGVVTWTLIDGDNSTAAGADAAFAVVANHMTETVQTVAN